MAHDEMSPNASIQCGVCSCRYHDESNFCCLDCIHVDPLPGAASGKVADESCCGSYKSRGC